MIKNYLTKKHYTAESLSLDIMIKLINAKQSRIINCWAVYSLH